MLLSFPSFAFIETIMNEIEWLLPPSAAPWKSWDVNQDPKAVVGHLSLRNGAARAADLGVLSLEALPCGVYKTGSGGIADGKA